MKNLSDEIMLGMLTKVQAHQTEILKAGHSVHIDASVHEDIWESSKTHIDFCVYIYEGNSLTRSFDFNSLDSQEELDATYAMFVAYIKNL